MKRFLLLVCCLPLAVFAFRPPQTVCTFAQVDLKVTLTWSTPKLPENLEVF